MIYYIIATKIRFPIFFFYCTPLCFISDWNECMNYTLVVR